MHRNKWLLLLVTTSATSLVFLDNTILPVSLPTIGNELGFSALGLIWVVNCYVLTLAALMIVGGRLYDLIGMRKTYLLGLFLFGLGSVLGGFSLAKWWLLLGRIIQGCGGALLLPTTGAILIESFPPGQRGKALGINTGISSIFLIIGPALGGLITEYLFWRLIFWINIPIVLMGMVMAYKLLPEKETKKESFDFKGAILFALSMATLVVALMEATNWGWKSYLIWALLGSSLVFFYLFLLATKVARHPLIDFSLLKRPLFRGGNFCILLTQMALMITVIWAIFFQQVLTYTPVQAGFLMLAATVPVIVLAPVAGHLVDRYGPKIPIGMGFGLLIFAFIYLAIQVPFTSPYALPLGLIPFGCGIALILSPSFVIALSDVPPEKLGSGSSITSTTRQIASTLGIAFITALYHSTNNPYNGFTIISYYSIILCIVGLIFVLFVIKEK